MADLRNFSIGYISGPLACRAISRGSMWRSKVLRNGLKRCQVQSLLTVHSREDLSIVLRSGLEMRCLRIGKRCLQVVAKTCEAPDAFRGLADASFVFAPIAIRQQVLRYPCSPHLLNY